MGGPGVKLVNFLNPLPENLNLYFGNLFNWENVIILENDLMENVLVIWKIKFQACRVVYPMFRRWLINYSCSNRWTKSWIQLQSVKPKITVSKNGLSTFFKSDHSCFLLYDFKYLLRKYKMLIILFYHGYRKSTEILFYSFRPYQTKTTLKSQVYWSTIPNYK